MHKTLNSFLTVVLTVSFFLMACQQNSKVNSPKRLNNIPVDAAWIGGTDGGAWFCIKEKRGENSFRVGVYNDNNGELESDTVYTLNAECSLKHLDSASLIKQTTAPLAPWRTKNLDGRDALSRSFIPRVLIIGPSPQSFDQRASAERIVPDGR